MLLRHCRGVPREGLHVPSLRSPTTLCGANHHHAIWLHLRITLSYRDVEDLLVERGLDVP